MKRKNYRGCEDIEQLMMRVMQNTIISFLIEERIMSSLEKLHYLYHQRVHNALQGTSLKKVLESFWRITLYLRDKEDDKLNDLFLLLLEEYQSALWGTDYEEK